LGALSGGNVLSWRWRASRSGRGVRIVSARGFADADGGAARQFAARRGGDEHDVLLFGARFVKRTFGDKDDADDERVSEHRDDKRAAQSHRARGGDGDLCARVHGLKFLGASVVCSTALRDDNGRGVAALP
jgi:hypothetical protein